MATYNLTGIRYLRKYTAPAMTPVVATSTEVAKVVDNLCDVPWEITDVRDATMSSHSTEVVNPSDDEEYQISGLDYNVLIRDQLDAALFCAEHFGGMHTVYANAACYVFELPDEAVGVSLSSLTAKVTSDNYNSNGARIRVYTSSTLDIPTNCRTCRNDNSSGTMIADGMSASGVAPRTVETVEAEDEDEEDEVYWYPTTASCTLTPTGGLTLQKYLYLFVLMENYASSRGNWVEGCSYIARKISITTATAVSGWTDGEAYDLVPSVKNGSTAINYALSDSGATPSVASGVATGRRTLVSMEGGSHGLHAAYRTMLEGGGEAEKAGEGGADSSGAYWKVRQTVKGWEVEAGATLVPFVMPSEAATSLSLSYSSLSVTAGAKYRVFIQYANVTDASALFATSALWDGNGDLGSWQLLGEITSGTSAAFKLPEYTTERYATVLIVGYIPPDKVTVETSLTWQGATVDFKPLVKLV